MSKSKKLSEDPTEPVAEDAEQDVVVLPKFKGGSGTYVGYAEKDGSILALNISLYGDSINKSTSIISRFARLFASQSDATGVTEHGVFHSRGVKAYHICDSNGEGTSHKAFAVQLEKVVTPVGPKISGDSARAIWAVKNNLTDKVAEWALFLAEQSGFSLKATVQQLASELSRAAFGVVPDDEPEMDLPTEFEGINYKAPEPPQKPKANVPFGFKPMPEEVVADEEEFENGYEGEEHGEGDEE